MKDVTPAEAPRGSDLPADQSGLIAAQRAMTPTGTTTAIRPETSERPTSQVRLLLQEGAAVGQKTAQQGAVALEQRVGELDHTRVGPAVLAHAQKLQESGLFLAGRVLAHQDGGSRGRARDASMAMYQHMAVGPGVNALAELQHLHDMRGRAGLEAGIFGHDVVEADQLVFDPEVAVEGGRPGFVGVDDRQHMADADGAMQRQLGDAADRDFVGGEGHVR